MTTIIYRISKEGLDKNYIGSTVDLNKRISRHRSLCKGNNQRQLYRYINENGGFDEWKFTILATLCNEDINPKKIEQAYIDNNIDCQLNERCAYIDPSVKEQRGIEYRKKYNKLRYDCCCGTKGLTWKNKIQHEMSDVHQRKCKKIREDSLLTVTFD